MGIHLSHTLQFFLLTMRQSDFILIFDNCIGIMGEHSSGHHDTALMVSLDNFDENSERLLLTPRSLEACQSLGIEPVELLAKPASAFAGIDMMIDPNLSTSKRLTDTLALSSSTTSLNLRKPELLEVCIYHLESIPYHPSNLTLTVWYGMVCHVWMIDNASTS
jgi:hypothetical protein